MPLRLWSLLIEVGFSNLALLHCSCLHACLAAYSNVLIKDLNTTCITIKATRVKGVIMSLALYYWMGGAHHCSRPLVSEMTYKVSSGTLNSTIPYLNHGVWRHGRGTVVSACEILWSARLNASKVTANRQEDRSSQWEATRYPWGFRQQGYSW